MNAGRLQVWLRLASSGQHVSSRPLLTSPTRAESAKEKQASFQIGFLVSGFRELLPCNYPERRLRFRLPRCRFYPRRSMPGRVFWALPGLFMTNGIRLFASPCRRSGPESGGETFVYAIVALLRLGGSI